MNSAGLRVGGGIPRIVEAPLSALALLLCSPFLVFVGLCISCSSPGPALYRQERVGRNGKVFTLLKFRTMEANKGGPQVTSRGDPRVTPIGRLLRATKLDELPELWNVIRGDLSLVGPRPEVPRYVNLDSPSWKKVLGVRPGITDPVTIRLRNEEALMALAGDDPESFYLEVLQPFKLRGYTEYIRRRTARSDLVVLFRTLRAVLRPSSAPPPTLEEIRNGVPSEPRP